MLNFILIAQMLLPAQVPTSPSVRFDTPKKSDNLLYKQQIRQLEEKLNATQKHYELKIQELEILPSSKYRLLSSVSTCNRC